MKAIPRGPQRKGHRTTDEREPSGATGPAQSRRGAPSSSDVCTGKTQQRMGLPLEEFSSGTELGNELVTVTH